MQSDVLRFPEIFSKLRFPENLKIISSEITMEIHKEAGGFVGILVLSSWISWFPGCRPAPEPGEPRSAVRDPVSVQWRGISLPH